MIARMSAIVFVLILVVGVPALSYVTARRADIRLIPRRALYLSAAISQWFLALLGFVAVLAMGWGFRAVGLHAVPADTLLRWVSLLTFIALATLGFWLLLERLSGWPEESDLVYLLMPETRKEKVWAVLMLAPTAAFCEEFLYRGFLLTQLSAWLDSGLWGLLLSSVAFALAHVYQGPSGMLRVGLLGALLAYPVLRLGSIYPSMAAHFLIDAVALAWLGPRLVRKRESV